MTNDNQKKTRREMTYSQAGKKRSAGSSGRPGGSNGKKSARSGERSSTREGEKGYFRAGERSPSREGEKGYFRAGERSSTRVGEKSSSRSVNSSASPKKKRVLTPEEKRLREQRLAKKRAEEDDRKIKSMQSEAKERARLRRERQEKAARKRKKQLLIRAVLLVILVIAVVVGYSSIKKAINKKKLEPEGGTGTNILQAAEEAVEKENMENGSTSGSTGSGSESGQNTGNNQNTGNGENTGAGQNTGTSGNQTGDNSQSVNQNSSSSSLSLCMIGDVILHQRLLDCSATENGYDFSNLFVNVAAEVQRYDIKIANQETILGGPALEYTGYPSFNSPYEEADALANTGFNVVLQATNHTLDKGQPAVQNCLNYWNNTYPNIAVLGIHDDNEPSQDIYVFEKNGIRVAILNYTYGTNKCQEEVASGELANEVNFLEAGRVQEDIARANELADYIVVCPHWGVENEFEYNSEQELWTAYFLEWGVDLVLGTHPHVIQPIEKLTRADGHQMLVYYSLGNYVSNQSDRYGNVGAMAQIVIEKDSTGQVVTKDFGVRTLVTHESYDGEAYTTYFLDDYSEEMAASNEVTATDPEFSYSYCCSLRDQIFGSVGSIQVG